MNKKDGNDFEGILRPGRYIGREWNAVCKNVRNIKLHICLCFPEIYELGMSNLGFRIIYDLLNSKRDIYCERCFCPWIDFKNRLKKLKEKLYSLETQTPLDKFDILGFSINNELNYTNILAMLELANIPFFAKDRKGNLPLIIAGGNCVLNPEPLADFFDLFIIGEAEEAILKVSKICKIFRRKFGSLLSKKQNLLLELAQIEGVYVPNFYRVEYSKSHTVVDFRPIENNIATVIKKVHVSDLDKSLLPTSWIVPNIEIIHDRIGIEIMRGCSYHCRFCQARNYFFPLRLRSPEKIISMAKKLYKLTGYEEIALLSLSSSCHPQIKLIIDQLVSYFRDKSVSISFPSMRPKDSVKYISYILSQQHKSGLTFAPEAGTDRLRNIIRKDFDVQELKDTLKIAYQYGYRKIKLYFMIGLPTEREEDLDGIIDLVQQISEMRKDIAKQNAYINVSVSTFIPKPHTPFQWMPMASIKEIFQ